VSQYPKLRGDLVIRKVAEGDDVAYTVCDSHRDKYFRIDPYTRLVAIQLDGKRSLTEVSRLCQEAMPYNDFSLPVVEEAVQDLDAMGVLENPYTKNLLLLERARASRPRITDFFQNMLLWKVGVWDPDPLLARTVGRVGWLFRPSLAIFVAAGLVWCTFLVFVNRHRLDFDLLRLLVGKDGGAMGLVGFLLILTVVGAIHEFGHAYSCKHFGGSVHRMGFMLMYFSPCFFVDVSQSMLFENRWQRIWVAMAGIFFESFITIAAAVVWWITPIDLQINDIAYRVMIYGLIVGVLLNLNPLLKFDGYFVLSDLLQIGELRERSAAYVRERLIRPFKRDRKPEPVLGVRRRRAYLTYGFVTLAYSAIVIVCFFEWLRVTLVGAFAEVGFIAFAAMVGMFIRRPVRRAFSQARSLARRPIRAILPWALAILFLAVLAQIIHTPGYVQTRASLISPSREVVRAEGPGRVAAVFAREGDRVLPGQVVAVLENDSVLAAWEEARSGTKAGAIELARAVEGDDAARYAGAAGRHGAALAEEANQVHARARLALASRAGGIVVSPRTEEHLGVRLESGDTLLVIADDRALLLECVVNEHDIGDIEPGQRLTFRTRGDPGRRITGSVEQILPLAPQEPGVRIRFRVRCSLNQPPTGLRLGESGFARIEVARWNLYERMARAWARFVRADFWI